MSSSGTVPARFIYTHIEIQFSLSISYFASESDKKIQPLSCSSPISAQLKNSIVNQAKSKYSSQMAKKLLGQIDGKASLDIWIE